MLKISKAAPNYLSELTSWVLKISYAACRFVEFALLL